ncbi:MAG: hypothetical protein C5B58_06575 [Acidobacteria bacterium]|nr:MAG: hypothetical protein C5B58_06575 [Acidobacteriota bacterium]
MLGEELRKAREAANMTQEKVSFEAELDRTYIQSPRKQQAISDNRYSLSDLRRTRRASLTDHRPRRAGSVRQAKQEET